MQHVLVSVGGINSPLMPILELMRIGKASGILQQESHESAFDHSHPPNPTMSSIINVRSSAKMGKDCPLK